MSRSDWIKATSFIAVLFVLLALGWQVGLLKIHEYASDREEVAAQEHEGIEASIQVCREPDGFVIAFFCAYKATSADGGEYASKKDLKVQQDMSIWAYGMFITSAASVLITSFGILFVWLTLKKADETNNAAITAAQAAQATNKIMRADQRPWIDFDISQSGIIDVMAETYDKEMRPSGQTLRLYCTLTAYNFGKTPATDVDIRYSIVADRGTVELKGEHYNLLNQSGKFGSSPAPEVFFPGRPQIIRDKQFVTAVIGGDPNDTTIPNSASFYLFVGIFYSFEEMPKLFTAKSYEMRVTNDGSQHTFRLTPAFYHSTVV